MSRYHDNISLDNAKQSRPSHKRDITMSTTIIQTKKCICCDERWNFVKTKKICFTCLTQYHNTNMCRKRKLCGINECQKYHNKLLQKNEHVNSNHLSENVSTITTAQVNCHISSNRHVLRKILAIIINCKQVIKTYALLDDASTVTLIDQNLAYMLNMSGPQQLLTNYKFHSTFRKRVPTIPSETRENN